MNYTLEWSKYAVDELAAVWLAVADQTGPTRLVHQIEQALMDKPLKVGEAKGSSVRRIFQHAPLGIGFDVVEDDKKVIVQTCWLSR